MRLSNPEMSMRCHFNACIQTGTDSNPEMSMRCHFNAFIQTGTDFQSVQFNPLRGEDRENLKSSFLNFSMVLLIHAGPERKSYQDNLRLVQKLIQVDSS